MAVVEITDRERLAPLLGEQPMRFLEALDESILGDGIVSVFADDVAVPPNLLVVRWSQSALGLRSAVQLSAGCLTGLEEVVRALPSDRGHYDVSLPFWSSPAFAGVFKTEVLGAEACYWLPSARWVSSPVLRQC